MTTDAPTRGGFVGFMSTIPGILTACAALLTAMATVAGVQMSSGGGGSPEPPPVPVVTVPAPVASSQPAVPSPEPAPPAPDRAESGDVVLPEDLGLAADDPEQQLADSCAAGDVDACGQVLEGLAGECYDGYLGSCDLLYIVSPVGSDYEYYGATCGLRYDDSFAGACSEES